MPAPLSFVCSAPGKVILAGEHSVVHRTRALATVIDKRTYCHFAFTPAAEEAAEPTVSLCIDTEELQATYAWTWKELQQKAITLDIPTSLPALLSSLDALISSIRSLPHANDETSTKSVAPQVFLLYYLVLLRGGSQAAPHTRGSLAVTVRSQLPMSAGLGSSAAYTSSLSAGFVWLALQLHQQRHQALQHADDENAAQVSADLRSDSHTYLGERCNCAWSEVAYVIPRTGGLAPLPAVPTFQPCEHLKKAINQWAYQGERIIHGNPSGVDNTCAVYGGIVVYRKDEENQFLQSVPHLGLLVVNTRIPRDTKKLVAGVGVLKTRYPSIMNPLFAAVDALVGEWLGLLQPPAAPEAAGASSAAPLSLGALEERVGQLMRINQGALDAMGVGHPHIHRVLRLAAAHGFDAGKLTGAGGGGCIIILQPSGQPEGSAVSAAASTPASRAAALDAFTRELRQELNCDYLETVVGQAGVWIRNGMSLEQVPELQHEAAVTQAQPPSACSSSTACARHCPWTRSSKVWLAAAAVFAAGALFGVRVLGRRRAAALSL